MRISGHTSLSSFTPPPPPICSAPLLPSAQPRPEPSWPRRPELRKNGSIRVLSRGGLREWLYDEQGEEPTPETETS